MTIKRKLTIVSLLPLLLAVTVGAIHFFTGREEEAALRQGQLAVDVMKGASDLTILSYEYAKDRRERPVQQWRQRYASLAIQIELFTATGFDEEGSVQSLRGTFADLSHLFEELVEARNNVELSHRLTGQLLAQVNNLIAMAGRLAKESQAENVALRERTKTLVRLLVFTAAALIAGAAILVARGVIRPVARLRLGMEKVGAGDLNHEIGYTANDELGNLARTFDDMTNKLRRVTVSRDQLQEQVTQRERAEAALARKAAALARSNSDLEQFAYVASHDLQEPLRAVAGFCQLLQRRYEEKLAEEGRDYIRKAVEGAERMQTLIQDLLEFSRVSRKGGAFQPTDLNEVVRETLAQLQMLLKESGAKIDCHALPIVPADRGQLISLFQNLIGNALKYRTERAPEVRISAQDQGGEWLFSIQDNGIGIAPEYFGRIFGIFQRLHTRGQYPGTGIGLAICKRVVECHGGRLWVDSKVNEGSTFYFSLAKKAAIES